MTQLKTYLAATVAVTMLLSACKDASREARQSADAAKVEMADTLASFDAAAVDAALAAQPDTVKARYQYRNPGETLEFFGIAPGMTVVDALPGAEGKGWYTGILAQILGANGADGQLVGVDYSINMWPEFGGFADAEFIEAKKTWAADWVKGAEAREAAGDFGDADIGFTATTFGGANGQYAGMADAVLFMRAMHNLSRFEANGGYMTEAVGEAYAMLKPGGIAGVVQHRAPANADAGWATGSNGYVKQQAVIDAFTAAGFEFVGSSEINANPKDQPDTSAESKDAVWRLPPTLGTSREDDALKASMEAIGESDRMTLKFRKPA